MKSLYSIPVTGGLIKVYIQQTRSQIIGVLEVYVHYQPAIKSPKPAQSAPTQSGVGTIYEPEGGPGSIHGSLKPAQPEDKGIHKSLRAKQSNILAIHKSLKPKQSEDENGAICESLKQLQSEGESIHESLEPAQSEGVSVHDSLKPAQSENDSLHDLLKTAQPQVGTIHDHFIVPKHCNVSCMCDGWRKS